MFLTSFCSLFRTGYAQVLYGVTFYRVSTRGRATLWGCSWPHTWPPAAPHLAAPHGPTRNASWKYELENHPGSLRPKKAVKRYGICWVADWWICSWFGCVDDEVSELTRPGLTCKITDWLLIVQEMVFQRQLQAQPTFASQIYIFWTCTKCKSVRLKGTASRHRKKSIGSNKWLPYASNSFFRVWVPDDIGAIWVCWKSKRNQEPTGSSSPPPQ